MSKHECRSMKDVIAFAIEREEEARDFYLQCRDSINKKALQPFFQELADEEENHRQLLLKRDVSNLKDFEPAQVQNLKISDFMVDIPFSAGMGYQDALTLAMKKEEKAHAFYSAWQNRCSDSETARLFGFLAGEELKHKRKIENVFDDDILKDN
ncbi:MAG: ferritin family protein [Thermodesulfobacteriota bacterium]